MTRAKPEDFISKEIHGDFGMDTQSIFPPFYAVLYSQWIREGELEFNGLSCHLAMEAALILVSCDLKERPRLMA